MALSSCNAETQARTPAGQNTLYVNNLVTEIMGEVLLSSHIYRDNVASLFLPQYNQVGQRMKHIDIKHRFVHDLVVKEIIKH